MTAKRYLAACDLGASNGRVILGIFDGKRIETREIHRFENGCEAEGGLPVWKIRDLAGQIACGLGKAGETARAEGGELASFGIDTWGVDYGLLDAEGKLLGDPRAYRAAREEDMAPVFGRIPFPELFAETGNAAQSYNTLFQLYRRKLEGDPELEKAAAMLFTPDLLAYLLTGEKGTEYTIASTSMMLDAGTGDWNRRILDRLELPGRILTPIEKPGTFRGFLKEETAKELGLGKLSCIAVGSHDTASAVAAIPGRGDLAFCSSGTWSLIGVERPTAFLSDKAREQGFTNEGTVQGGYRVLKNLMGLYLIQQCRKDWLARETGRPEKLGWGRIAQAASEEPAFRSLIDTEDPCFFSGEHTEEKIREYCRRTGQPVPETRAQTARCIYESMALQYRKAFRDLQEIRGGSLKEFHFTGGGIQNRLLDQMAADACGCTVTTGPVEGAALGNLLTQAMALGDLSGVDEIRETVRASEEIEEYIPAETGRWQEAEARLDAYRQMTAGKRNTEE